MADLKDKLDQVKDEHAVELVDARDAAHNERQHNEALFLLGRIKQNEQIAVAISTNLTAQTIRALELFQEDGMYRQLGYQTFVDFLEKSEYSPMSKRQYYERRELMNAHGDEIYDLLTSVGISVRAQKMLGAGDLRIEGDRLMIGEDEIDIGSTSLVKQAIQELVEERRDLQAAAEKLETKNSKLETRLNAGQAEYEELQRNLDRLLSGSPFDRVFAHAVNAMAQVPEVVGELDDKVKAAKRDDCLSLLWQLHRRIDTAFGGGFEYRVDAPPADENVIDSMVREVMQDTTGLDETEGLD